MEFVFEAITIGIIATIVMDIWAFIAKRLLLLPTANWAHVGRWIGHMFRGKLAHNPISGSAPISHEMGIGWLVHYLTGIAYGIAYLYIIQVVLQRSPSILSALTFGLVTLVAPWLIMQPALGAGVFARHTPKPGKMRLVNLSMHVVFGIGLFLGWYLIQ